MVMLFDCNQQKHNYQAIAAGDKRKLELAI